MSIFPKTLTKAFSEETDESQRASPYQTLGKIIDISIGEAEPCSAKAIFLTCRTNKPCKKHFSGRDHTTSHSEACKRHF